ncbi:transcription-associated protein 1, partial [Cryomyces antarcticus]
MKIVTAIFNVFHLLPPAAIQFLKELVERVIELEVALRRTHNSPFREPLVKYLNHYPKEAWNFFRPQIKNEVFGRFFAQILAYPASGPLREAVAGDVSGFLETLTKEGSEEERWPAVINAIHVAQSLCKFPETRSWLAPHESLKEALFNSAKELQIKLRDNSIEPGLRLAVEQAGERVMEVFTTYMAHQREDLDFFFEIVEAVTKEELKSCPPLFDFITCHMVSNNSVDYWRTLVLR